MIAFFAPVPAREGFEWMKLSLQIFRGHWTRYTALASIFLMVLLMSSALTGGLLFPFIKPILSVGFLAAAWHHERGEIPELRQLFAGFRSNLRALIPLGLVYFLGLMLAMSVSFGVSGLTLEQVMAAQEAQAKGAAGPVLPPDAVELFMLVTIALTLPLTAALWFSPALIVFSDATFTQSLVLSVRACLKNWRAIVVYALSLFAFLMLTGLLLRPVLLMLSPGLKSVTMILTILPLTAIQMIGDYVSYRRIFHRDERVEKVAGAA